MVERLSSATARLFRCRGVRSHAYLASTPDVQAAVRRALRSQTGRVEREQLANDVRQALGVALDRRLAELQRRRVEKARHDRLARCPQDALFGVRREVAPAQGLEHGALAV